MPNCKINNQPMKINTVHRRNNGDIAVQVYCYGEGSAHSHKNKLKKITHAECETQIIYKNGENFNLKRSIYLDKKYKNLIGCWCNDNLRFQTPVEAQNHRLEKHPEEFQEIKN